MNCPQCQAPADDSAAFCSRCGTALATIPPGVPTAPGGFRPPWPGGPAPSPAAPPAAGVPYVFSLQRLSAFDRILAVTTLVAMISIWLPWFTATGSNGLGGTISGSFSGTGQHGYLWLEFVLALVILVYLAARAGWDRLPGGVILPHDPALRAGAAIQFLLIVIAFFDMPSGGTGITVGWDFGAVVGLLAALVPVGVLAVPVIRTFLANRNAGQRPAS